MSATGEDGPGFYDKMRRSRERCLDIAKQENVWGYTSSAEAYREMAQEMWDALWWVARQVGGPVSGFPYAPTNKGS